MGSASHGAGTSRFQWDPTGDWLPCPILRSGSGASPLVFALYQHVWLFTFLGVSSLVLELGAPLALFHRRLGQLWCLAALAMHWGIYFIMDIEFTYYLYGVIYAPFFALESLIDRRRATNS